MTATDLELSELRIQRDELLRAAKAQHKALDHLFAMLIAAVPGFMPSQSAAWAALVQGSEAIKRAEGRK